MFSVYFTCYSLNYLLQHILGVFLHYWYNTVFLPQIHWKYTHMQCVGFTSELLLAQSPCAACWELPLTLLTVCPDHSLSIRCSCVPFLQPGRQDLTPPHRSLLLHQTFPHQSTCFPLSLSLHATQGNDSITYDPIHLLMMSGHSKAHLSHAKSSSHSLCSSLGVSVSWVKQQGSPLWDTPDMHICVFLILPLRLFPMFRIFEDLGPVMGLFQTVWRVWLRWAMCQEKLMALLGMKPPAAGPVRVVLIIIRN